MSWIRRFAMLLSERISLEMATDFIQDVVGFGEGWIQS